MTTETLTIRKTYWNKFNRKTGKFDRLVEVMGKYVITEVRTGKTGHRAICVKGPKAEYVLIEQQQPMKDGTRYFHVHAVRSANPNANIQGATGFMLRPGTTELIPCHSAGFAGYINEIEGYKMDS